MYKAKKEMLEIKDELGMHDDGLLDTNLMPLINTAWQQSFARRVKNLNALADRGWNPLNKNLLHHEDLRATMTTLEKSSHYHLSNEIVIPQSNSKILDESTLGSEITGTTESETSSSFVLSNHPSVLSLVSTAPKLETDELNFASGESLRCTKAMLSQEQLHAARERIREDMSNGQSIRDQLKANSRLSVGILFKSGSTRLGKTVFDVCRENIEDKKNKAIEKIMKDKNEYHRNVENATKVWEKKGEIENMTIRELTIVCKPLKLKSDGKMPIKKDQLIYKFKEWSGRPTPVFHIENVHVENDEVENDDENDNIELMDNNILCEVEI